jgi:hypothetical protein
LLSRKIAGLTATLASFGDLDDAAGYRDAARNVGCAWAWT